MRLSVHIKMYQSFIVSHTQFNYVQTVAHLYVWSHLSDMSCVYHDNHFDNDFYIMSQLYDVFCDCQNKEMK